MRIEINIGVTPRKADARRRSQAVHHACRRAAELAYEDFQTFSFIHRAHLLTEPDNGIHPARLILTSRIEKNETANNRYVVVHDGQSQDSIFCSLLNELEGDREMVSHWPEMINLYNMFLEGWEVPTRITDTLLDSLVKYQRKEARKRLVEYFKWENAPLSDQLINVKCLDGEMVYVAHEDLSAIRKAVLALPF